MKTGKERKANRKVRYQQHEVNVRGLLYPQIEADRILKNGSKTLQMVLQRLSLNCPGVILRSGTMVETHKATNRVLRFERGE